MKTIATRITAAANATDARTAASPLDSIEASAEASGRHISPGRRGATKND